MDGVILLSENAPWPARLRAMLKYVVNKASQPAVNLSNTRSKRFLLQFVNSCRIKTLQMRATQLIWNDIVVKYHPGVGDPRPAVFTPILLGLGSPQGIMQPVIHLDLMQLRVTREQHARKVWE
jgi:hypothetical protein